MDAEDPLFILYTSGSTGKPKGVLHTTGGYLVYAAMTHRYVFDYRPGDIYWCTADIGWVTGHSYIVYGPMANRATTMMFEGVPNYPDFGRFWQIVEQHKVNIFYTAPTALRALMKEGDAWPAKYDLSSLRILGTVGEPIKSPEWHWYFQTIGQERCPIVDTWWQTETGGILITPLPGATKTKPGSATRPFFGVQPCLVDDQGTEVEGNGVSGNLCLKFPWPGIMRTVYGDHERFIQTYFSAYPGKYFSGDGCRRDEDGYYWITGRVDDVINVSGHRLGTAEIEGALGKHPAVAEARGGRHAARPQRAGHLCLCDAQDRPAVFCGHGEGAEYYGPPGDRPARHTGQSAVRRRAAQDAERKNHAAYPAENRRGGHRSARGHVNPGRSFRGRSISRRTPLGPCETDCMALRFHNTLTGKAEEFVPLTPGEARMYVCGVTVYDRSHIGHARALVAFDVIYRYLRFSGYEVTFVRNFTDVDDKIINRANERGISAEELTETYIQDFKNDMRGAALPAAYA